MRIALLAVFCLLCVACSEARFNDLEGNEIDFNHLEGQWVVINYWALWCAPCREEIPELNQLDQQNDVVRVLGVDFDDIESEQELRRQIELLGIEFAVLQQDPALGLGSPKPQVLPTTMIIDPQGSVAEVLVGPQSAGSILKQIALLKGEQGAEG